MKYSISDKQQHVYDTFATKDSFVDFLLSDGSKFANECLYAATHFYLDIDVKEHTVTDLGFKDETDFISQATDFLKNCFKKYLDVQIRSKQCLWAVSSRTEKLTSYHCVVNTETWYWSKEARSTDLKSFAKQIAQDSLDLHGFYYYTETDDCVKKTSIIDTSIYNKNRCFRVLGSAKWGSTVSLQPIGLEFNKNTLKQFLVTISQNDISDRIEYKFKHTPVKQTNCSVSRSVLEAICEKYNIQLGEIKGSLITCKNIGTRICPVTEGCCNETDNAFLVLKNGAIFYGCHDSGCKGKLLKVHSESSYKLYEDWKRVVSLFNSSPESFQQSHIDTFLKETVSLVDIPGNLQFHTWSSAPVTAISGQVSKKSNLSKSLFTRFSDIHLVHKNKKYKFSDSLVRLAQHRQLKTYTSVEWIPFNSFYEKTVETPSTVLNTFAGFHLGHVRRKKEIKFENTKIHELLYDNLCNKDDFAYNFLASMISRKLCRPNEKIPICLAWLQSRQGLGKGSFLEFLRKLFATSVDTVTSINRMSSFISPFNAARSTSLWCCLEEVKGDSLKEFDNVLKDEVTCTYTRQEKKGVDAVMKKCYYQLLIFSNTNRCLKIDQDDRRFALFTGSKKVKSKEWFTKLYSELDSVYILRAAWDYFMEFDTSTWNFRNRPKSVLLEQLKISSESVDARFVRFLFLEYFPVTRQYEFSKEELHVAYSNFIGTHDCRVKKERTFICVGFELMLETRAVEDVYSLSFEYVRDILFRKLNLKLKK